MYLHILLLPFFVIFFVLFSFCFDNLEGKKSFNNEFDGFRVVKAMMI